MARISIDEHNKLLRKQTSMETDRLSWWRHWRELGDMYLPRRYAPLLSSKELKGPRRNTRILDSTGTIALRIQSSGMMNSITSPSRRWFKIRIKGMQVDSEPYPLRLWLDQVELELLTIMAESNFYKGLGTVYIDLGLFGTASLLIYEDDETVIRCYNSPLGQYYLSQSHRQEVNTFSRELELKVHQVVERWGLENCSQAVREAWRQGGDGHMRDVQLYHMIEPNVDNKMGLSTRFAYREVYWEKGQTDGTVLSVRPFNELPGIHPRWEVSGNEAYGESPGMDAYGDVMQLQHETKAKGKSLDKMNDPPLIADVQLEHRPTNLMPRGITFHSGLINGGPGIRPVYTVNPPIGELTQDIAQVQSRIQQIFHNDLFFGISQLDTVRSALEVAERKEEKLIQLGPILERFESEALDPAINRIYAIAERAGLIPPPPSGFEGEELEIQYQSILSIAQRAVNTVPTERFLQLIGNIAPLYPKAVNIPNFDQLISDYGRDIGVPATGINDPDRVAELGAQQDAQEAAAEDAALGQQLAQGAQTLSQTDVGGGVNALEVLGGTA